jgi:hypothetical protein
MIIITRVVILRVSTEQQQKRLETFLLRFRPIVGGALVERVINQTERDQQTPPKF